jgi:peroxiredoxin
LRTLLNDNDGKAGSTGMLNMASLQRADGAHVGISSSNTAVSQYVATSTSRTAPLFSAEQLEAMARSDAWVE